MNKAVVVVAAIVAAWFLPVRDASAQCAAKATVCPGGLCCDAPYSSCCPGNMCNTSGSCSGSSHCPSNSINCGSFCCPMSAPTCCPGNKCSSSPGCASGPSGAGGNPPSNPGDETGCDGKDQKGVMVPCAGVEFCTCADHCDKNADCVSDCCWNSVCVPKCACDTGGGASLCKVGDSSNDPRASESGGCSIGDPADSHGAGLALLALLGLRGLKRTSRRPIGRKGDK